MDRPRTRLIYGKPPLKEAVLEFRFRPGAQAWDSIVFGRFYDAVDYFARTEAVYRAEIALEPAHVPFEVTAQQELKRFYSSNDATVATVGPGVFGFSVLPPRLERQHTWEALRDEALRLLDIYRDLAAPGPISRIGLRYINMLDVNPATFRLGDYVTGESGLIPTLLLEERNPFKFRVERTLAAEPDYQRREVINLLAGPSDTSGLGQIILDTDELFVVAESMQEVAAAEACEEMHGAVHDVFEAVVRPEVLESFLPETIAQEP